jgi:ABC-type histidine transport system ATPase subunit
MTYIIYGDNIYYLDENNLIFSIEGYHGTVRDGFLKNINFAKPVLDLQNNTFIESATSEEIKNIKNQKINLLKTKQYEELFKTDWYFTRFLENKIEIPIEILKERQEIRIKYDNLINEINNE